MLLSIQFNSTKYIFTILQHLHEKHSMQSCTHEKRTKEARKSFISSPLFLHMKPTSRDCTGSFSYHLPRRNTLVPDCWSRAHSALMGYFFLSITLKKVNLYNMIRYNTMHCNDFVPILPRCMIKIFRGGGQCFQVVRLIFREKFGKKFF